MALLQIAKGRKLIRGAYVLKQPQERPIIGSPRAAVDRAALQSRQLVLDVHQKAVVLRPATVACEDAFTIRDYCHRSPTAESL